MTKRERKYRKYHKRLDELGIKKLKHPLGRKGRNKVIVAHYNIPNIYADFGQEVDNWAILMPTGAAVDFWGRRVRQPRPLTLYATGRC